VLAADDKLSQKGAWSGHVNHFNFGGTSEARVVKFCTQVNYIESHAAY